MRPGSGRRHAPAPASATRRIRTTPRAVSGLRHAPAPAYATRRLQTTLRNVSGFGERTLLRLQSGAGMPREQGLHAVDLRESLGVAAVP